MAGGSRGRSSRSGGECRVYGPLGWVLVMARLAGVAPLRFSAPCDGRGWYIRVSPAFDIYSKIITVTLCSLSAAGLFMDLYVEPERSLRSSVVGSVIVYFTDITVMAAVVLAASFTGTRRMSCLISCIACLQRINCELNVYHRSSCRERNQWLILTVLLTWGLFTMTLDFGLFMKTVDLEYGRTLISSMYIFFNFLYVTQLIIQIQFSLVSLTLLWTLRKLNHCLKDVLHQIRTDASSAAGPIFKTSRNTLNLETFKVSVKSINGIIDSLANMETLKIAAPSGSTAPVPWQLAASVGRLAGAHAAVSDAVRRLDRSHGPMMLAVMVSSLVHLLITAYCLVCCFVTVINSQTVVYDPMMQSLWAVFHVSSFLIVIEPAHQTQQAMGSTKNLVSQMIQSAAPRDAGLVAQLELFYRQVSLNQVAYAPMKMCTLNRGIIATMLGTITTYLVVVIQL